MNASKVTKTYGQSNTSAKTESAFGTKTQGNGTHLKSFRYQWSLPARTLTHCPTKQT